MFYDLSRPTLSATKKGRLREIHPRRVNITARPAARHHRR